MSAERLRSLALDLHRTAPRSPRAAFTQYFPAVAARLVDKCRADLLGRAGSYRYKWPMDWQFFAATGLDAEALREFISTGADDTQIAVWIRTRATVSTERISAWSRRFCQSPIWRLLDLQDW